jgi:hypothetical protein
MASRVFSPKGFAENPRAPNDFAIDPKNRLPDFNIDVDVQRYSVYDLEGDLPAPSSIAPEKGLLQYFYLENLETAFTNTHGVTRNSETTYSTDSVPYFHQFVNGTIVTTVTLKTPNNDAFKGTLQFFLRRDMAEVAVTLTITGPDVSFTSTIENVLVQEFDVRDTGKTEGKITFRPLAEYVFAITPNQNNTDLVILREQSDETWESQVINDLKYYEELTNTYAFMHIYHNYEMIDNFKEYAPESRDFIYDPNYGGTYNDLSGVLNTIEQTPSNWTETGPTTLTPDGILNSYIVSGTPWYYDSRDTNNFWSASFVSHALHRAGFPALRTQSSLNYQFYGEEVDWRSWKNVRINDIIIFKSKEKSGGHIGFIKDFDPFTNEVTILNGNAQNKIKKSKFIIDNIDFYVRQIRRNWPDPGIGYKLPTV